MICIYFENQYFVFVIIALSMITRFILQVPGENDL